MPRLIGVRIELSVSQSYEQEPSMCEMMTYLYDLGFRLCAIEEAWSNLKTREVYQMDGVFQSRELTLGWPQRATPYAYDKGINLLQA